MESIVYAGGAGVLPGMGLKGITGCEIEHGTRLSKLVVTNVSHLYRSVFYLALDTK